MNLLYISNLFPDKKDFNRGIYNARFTRHLSKYCNIRVISLRPGFLFIKQFQSCPQDQAVKPIYSVVPYVPIYGSRFNHILMRLFLKSAIKKLHNEFKFDVVLASWIFPDACAVSKIAEQLKIPLVATALGTDIHQYINNPVRRKIILTELKNAAAIVTVSQSLAKLLIESGFNNKKVHTIYYGVEQDLFKPGNKTDARVRLNLPQDSILILFVGNFLPIKDPLLALDSFSKFVDEYKPQNPLIAFIGDGVLKSKLESRAEDLGLKNNVIFAGRKRPEEITVYMQAADVLCLTSHNEGVPNVVLEALSTGLPVVATAVGGVPEIIQNSTLGKLVYERSPKKIAEAIYDTIKNPPDKTLLISYARQYDWDQTAREYFNLLTKCVEQYKLKL
ncbi:MAG: glycosyltransferase [Verrucomicrobiia bacterium]|jgi:glycosyltransferase involved in cell wall biosynthesis